MKKRIIATDFDGTFIVHGEIAPNMRFNVNRWRNQGNYFGFVTGRGIDFFEILSEKHLDYVDFVILYNGALVCDIKGNIVFEELISKEEYFLLQKEFENMPLVQEYSKVSEDLFYHQFCAVFEKDEQAKDASDKINEKFSDIVTSYANGRNVNIVSKGIGKGSGVDKILEFYGFKHGQAAVVGDDFNDIDMIVSHNGWAVENAREEVLRIAPNKCKNVAELADALSKI